MTDKPSDVLRVAGGPLWVTFWPDGSFTEAPVRPNIGYTTTEPRYTEAQLLAMCAAGAEAEREVSDKLEKALKLAKAYIVNDVGAGNVIADALAEVAAIRKGQAS